jgi:hypothetical protein
VFAIAQSVLLAIFLNGLDTLPVAPGSGRGNDGNGTGSGDDGVGVGSGVGEKQMSTRELYMYGVLC